MKFLVNWFCYNHFFIKEETETKFSKSVAIELIGDRNLDVEQLSSSGYALSDVTLKGTREENTGLFKSRSGLEPWATDITVGFKKNDKTMAGDCVLET